MLQPIILLGMSIAEGLIMDILAGMVIGIVLLVGVVGLLKERQRRKEEQHS